MSERLECECGADIHPKFEGDIGFLFHVVGGHKVTVICDRMIGPYRCCSVVEGDCLSLMRDLPNGCVDAVITDPPFSSGARTDAAKSMRNGMVRGAKWDGGWFTHDNMATHGFLFLMRLLGVELLRCCRIGASGHFFIDWRMYPNLYGAIESSGWITKNLVVWDKQHFGMGSNYRNQHEFIIYAEKGDGEFKTHSIGNVIQCGRSGSEFHPTEKPVELIEVLLGAGSDRSDTILDPFCGSGTTLVAAKKLGRHFLGFEISPEYVAIANRRLAEIDAQPSLFEPKAEQLTLAQ
jgi:site-specific DNA-methyltransferase (adenine-specific)